MTKWYSWDRDILILISRGKSHLYDLYRELDVDESTMFKVLRRLEMWGLIMRTGREPRGRIAYRLTPQGRDKIRVSFGEPMTNKEMYEDAEQLSDLIRKKFRPRL